MSKTKRNMPREMSPAEARTTDQICALGRDNLTIGDFWILADGYRVTIAKQKPEEAATQSVTVPRSEFNRMVRWYVRPQKVRPI